MKPTRKFESGFKQKRFYQAVFCLVAILVAALQVGCSSTGAFPASQQVFRPPTPTTGYSANYANQGWGGQQGLFQSQPYGQNYGQNYGQPYGPGPINPAAGQFGFSGTYPRHQLQPNNGSPSQWGAGHQNLQSRWQNLQSNFNSNFSPFGFASSSC